MQRRRLVVCSAASLGVAITGCARLAEETAESQPATGPRRSYRLEFTKMKADEPALSAGGIWTNNEQGTGGHGAPGNMTNIRVGLASDGKTRIAMATHMGVNYDDSFAFVPGFGADQFIEAVVYREPGYMPSAHKGYNHEVELLLGCSSSPGVHEWNECLFNSAAGCDIVHLKGGPKDFTLIGNVEGRNRLFAHTGDVIRADKIGNEVSLYLNGVLKIRYDGRDPKRVARGDGIGIGAFIRPGAVHNKFGFISVHMGTL